MEILSTKPPLKNIIDKRQKNICCQLIGDMTVDEVLVATSMCNVALPYKSKKCKCGQLLLCKVVVVTALWDSNYYSSQSFFASIRTHLPYTPIVVFDVGLSQIHRNVLASLCNVVPRKLDIRKYPEHVKDLTTQAWKPIIIKETKEFLPSDYEIVLLCDDTCQFHSHIRSKLHYLAHHPVIPGQFNNHTFISGMHDGMKSYLGLNESREYYSSIRVVLSANGVLWLNKETTKYVLEPWLDCVLHKQCVEPSGVKAQRCNRLSLSSTIGTYGGCHKFTEAAYNGVLIRAYGIRYTRYLSSRRLTGLGSVSDGVDFTATDRDC